MTAASQIDVVLVAPRNPLNIGAAARAMANFGISSLTVVAPYQPHWQEALASAVDAESILARARLAPTLAEAVANSTLVLGTGTLTHRKPQQPVVPLPSLAPLVAAELARPGRIALVFGPEKHGLTQHDLSLCHRLVVIPTHPDQPSLNLGQAVAICLYEIAARALAGSLPAQPSVPAASSASLDRTASLIEESMLRAGYSPQSMQAANRHDLRLMLRRLQLFEKDTRRILGLFRRILAKLPSPQASARKPR